MHCRLDRQLTGKELSAHTLASFSVLQGHGEPGQIRAGMPMAAGTLKKLIGNTAFGYWVKNGWLHNAGDRASLTGAGALKVANRLAGRDGGYSVGQDAVLQMADIIRRGARSPFAGGEALESIPGPVSAAPAPPQVAAPSDIRSSATARPPSPASETAGPIKRARPGSKADPSSSLSPAPTPQPQPQPPDSGPACAPRQGAPPFRRSSAGPLYRQLEDLGRVRLSENFYMRDFLYSEIAYAEGIPNLPENPELAIEAGKQLCERVLEPLQAGVGRLAIRSAYRSPAVNAKGAENNNQYSCAGNERNRAAHIWDQRDEHGRMGATACVVVPAFQSCYERTGDWTALAWWIHDHVAEFHSLFFFPKLAAFNIRWLEDAPLRDSIRTHVRNPNTGDKAALVVRGVPTLSDSARAESWRRAFDSIETYAND